MSATTLTSVEEYLNTSYDPDMEWGAPNIWVFDPRTRRMSVFQKNALLEIQGDIIATESPRLELTRDEIFRD